MYVQTDGEELVLPLGPHTSVFQAEVFVLLTCAKLENLLFRNNCSIVICSDSLAVIKSVSAYKATIGLVADAMTALKVLATFSSVRLMWILGHCGIAGDEKVDMLARRLPPLALDLNYIRWYQCFHYLQLYQLLGCA